jgi:hypothetical protein
MSGSRGTRQSKSTEATLLSAQFDAERNLSRIEVAPNGAVSCSARVSRVPCDIQGFAVTEVRSKPLARSERRRGGPTRVNLDADDDGARRAYPREFPFAPMCAPGGAAYASGVVLEFVGGEKETDTRTDVKVAFAPLTQCAEHPRMTVTDPRGKKTVIRFGGATTLQLNYPSKFDALVEAASNVGTGKSYWLWGLEPAKWEVVVDVCGVRAGGVGAFGHTTARLHVYPPDEFELEFEIPPWRKDTTTVEASRLRDVRSGAVIAAVEATHTVEQRGLADRRGGGSQTDSVRVSHAERGGIRSPTRVEAATEVEAHDGRRSLSQRNAETRVGSRVEGVSVERAFVETSMFGTHTIEKAVFQVKRCGVPVLDRTQEIQALWGVAKRIQDAMDTVREIFEKIRAPQAGVVWKTDFSFEFLSGSIAARWGWREWYDHRCYLAYGVTFSLTLFSATFDFKVGVGIKGGPAEVTSSIGITGTTTFKLEGFLERAGPDDRRALDRSVKVEAEGSVSLYLEVIAGTEGFASAKGSVTVPVSATAKPSIDKGGFLLTYGAEIEATVAELEVQFAWCFKHTASRELLPRTVLIEDTMLRLA